MNKKINALIDKATRFWQYCAHGVWTDTRKKMSVNIVKTLNITVRSFLNADIQSQACAMAFRTMLAIVPALALIFAIGRGFGMQSFLQDELYRIFPSQHVAVQQGLQFVDSYLNQASEGLFVGVGIIFLLYTIVSLLMNMENCFNLIWNVRQGRTLWRKLSDYTAMLLILPVLLICAGGFEVFLNKTVLSIFHFSFMTPLLRVLFEVGSFVFTCLFFSAVFTLMPNTKVRFLNALLPGFVSGIGYTLLQWAFVSGQLYVSRYNAIYGSFSFLPLLLLWLQLVWVIVLIGGLLTYASQNIFQFSYLEQISSISRDYNEKVTVAIAATAVQRFVNKQPPITPIQLIANYGIPSKLVTNILDRLCDAHILSQVVINAKKQIYGFQPAVDPNIITINYLRIELNKLGNRDFIPDFSENFPGVISAIDQINKVLVDETEDIKLSDIKINTTDPTTQLHSNI